MGRPERRFLFRWALQLGCLPWDLERSVTSEQFTEMLAFERLEPFGPLHDEQMHGAMCALTVNMNRKKGTEPISAGHIFPALGNALGIGKVIELKDPKAMSRLIMDRVFKFKGKKRG